MRKSDGCPCYEWMEEFEWDDDEFEGSMLSGNCFRGQLGKCYDTVFSRFGRLETKEGESEIGIM